MANNMVGDMESTFVDKRRSSTTGITSTTSKGTPANYDSISALRTRLTAISATAYSAANLDAMTHNDMMYAVRLNDDLTGI